MKLNIGYIVLGLTGIALMVYGVKLNSDAITEKDSTKGTVAPLMMAGGAVSLLIAGYKIFSKA